MKTGVNLIIAIISFLLVGCFAEKKVAKEKKPVPITFASVQKKDMLETLDAIGHVEASSSVEIRSRVEGELLKVHFQEGDRVKKGDLLFEIDPRVWENQLKKTKAQLKENEVALALAKDRMQRNEKLIEKQYISELDWNDLVSQVEVLEASVAKNRADIEEAKLYLSYCKIEAPIDGVTGFLKVDEGNLIQPLANDVSLVRLLKINPIYVNFSLPEKYLTRIFKESKAHKLTVRVFEDEHKKNYIDGELNLIDNRVDTATGTIPLRAIFDNPKDFLWPGKFYPTRLIVSVHKNALVIPAEAVLITTKGPQVYVLSQDLRVQLREVLLGQKTDEEVVVLEGVHGDEKVVTKGQLNLYPDARVEIKNP